MSDSGAPRSRTCGHLERLALTMIVGIALSTPASAAIDYEQPLDDACWQQSFMEPFDELSLQSASKPDARWTTQYIWPRDVIINNELQYYLDPESQELSPFSVDDGILTIEAQPTPEGLMPQVSNQPFISGVLTTENGFSQQYGRFEALAKVPAGQGLWSAFWLLPSFDQWPEGVAVLPEIDVMEHLGHQVNTFHTTLHTNQTGELTSHPYDHTVEADLSADYHLYTVVWTPERVNWYLDREWIASHPTPEDFTRPVHFLLNLAVGGSWPGAPDESTVFPALYRIDHVAAWAEKKDC